MSSRMSAVDATAVSRRRFLGAAGLAVFGARALGAQQPQAQPQGENQGAANVPMDEGAYRSVQRPPKPNAKPLLTQQERDDLEHRIHCQCGCTLDVFTCRTTDFSCQVSPAMHADIMGLVAGGYSAQEIIDAFTASYGERVLMAPKREGFNLLGYFLPSVVLLTAGAAVAVLLRRWRRVAAVQAAARPVVVAPADASADELARIEAAVREDA